MKVLFFSILVLSVCLFSYGCKEDVSKDKQCITGKIVGQKCEIFALQLGQETMGASDWIKKDPKTGDIIATYKNVIGLINLPIEFRVDDKVIFVTLREPIPAENQISCYADMPNPPAPHYIVLSASETKCSEK
jgi:hypothetical protein